MSSPVYVQRIHNNTMLFFFLILNLPWNRAMRIAPRDFDGRLLHNFYFVNRSEGFSSARRC